MRLHTDKLARVDIYDAARIARVDLATFDDHGSRKRDHAYEVKLEGASKRRPNGGSSGAGSGYAATWDQWGVFLSVLFARDDMMTCWAYDGAEAFADRTGDRFGAPTVTMTADGYRDVFESYGWPTDAHGDHVFRYAGRPREFGCTKCSAVQSYA